MTLAEFQAALGQLQALPSDMADHMRELAPQLSDEQRAAAMAKVREIDAQLAANLQESIRIAQAGEEEVKKFRKEVLTPMRKDEETADRAADAKQADELFATI